MADSVNLPKIVEKSATLDPKTLIRTGSWEDGSGKQISDIHTDGQNIL